MAELRKQQELAAAYEAEANPDIGDGDDHGNTDEADTQDIEGETDGVVTRDSDNDGESVENDDMPQLEDMAMEASSSESSSDSSSD